MSILWVMERDMISRAFRAIFAFLDNIVYTLISWFMQAIFDIADFSITQGLFDKLIGRVYLILAIFMLFKITISLLNYLTNPDKVSDKENGMGKIITRTILVLVMLIMLPTGFDYLYKVQQPILKTLPRIIIASSNYEINDIFDEGQNISWTIFRAFFYNNPDCVGYDSSSSDDSILEPSFANDPTTGTPINLAFENVNNSCQGNDDMYQYEYSPIISTLAGGFVCFVLLGICISVAIRTFKLIILRMIAPISIISYIDLKSSKDGAFNAWIKTTMTTWLELFVNLGIIYLVVFLLDEILIGGASELITATSSLGFRRGAFFIVFIILGLFAFAKQAPQFILDSLGIKSKHSFGKALGLASAAIGIGGAAIASGRASYMASKTDNLPQKGWALMKSLPIGLLGGIAGVGTAGAAALSADKDQSKAAFDALSKRNATLLAQGDAGSTALGRMGSSFARVIYGETTANMGKRNIANLEAENKSLDAVVARADEEAVKSMDTKASMFKGSSLYTNYKSFAARMEAAKTSGAKSFDYIGYTKDASGNWVASTRTISMIEAEENIGWIKKDNANNYLEQVQAGTIKDARMPELMKDAELKTGRKFKDRNEIKNYQDELNNKIIVQRRKNAKAEQNDRFSGSKK